MESLKQNIGTVYYYIKNGVIYNILSYNTGDGCVKRGVDEVTNADKEIVVPSIKVKKEEDTASTKYFLTNFIEDGDLVYDSGFTKHDDLKIDGEEIGSGKTIPMYYQILCEQEIKNAILARPSADFEFFKKNKKLLGVPMFMLSGDTESTDQDISGYTVNPDIRIAFNKASFDETKEKVVQKEAYKAAQERAKDFGYKVTSDISGLTVTQLNQ